MLHIPSIMFVDDGRSHGMLPISMQTLWKIVHDVVTLTKKSPLEPFEIVFRAIGLFARTFIWEGKMMNATMDEDRRRPESKGTRNERQEIGAYPEDALN